MVFVLPETEKKVLNTNSFSEKVTMHKKGSFPLRISSVNLTRSVDNCGFGHIYRKNP